MKDDYKTSITGDEFIESFKKVQLTNKEIHLLQVLYNFRNRYLKGLEIKNYSNFNSVVTINSTFSRISKKISELTEVFPNKRENGKYRWWSLLATGERKDSHYSWQLRTEVIKALELNQIVEIKKPANTKVEERMARICWNTFGWVKPSGEDAKSLGKQSYENFAGFGWEEWLLETKKLIDGYHYGFIQAINNNWKTYKNRTMNIALFSINGKTKEKFWIGKLNNVEIIDSTEAERIFRIYEKNGWIEEMKNQVSEVNGDTNEFEKSEFVKSLFNLRFKPENITILEDPIKISPNDKIIKATYLSTLYYFKDYPNLEDNINNKFEFSPGHKKRKLKAKQKRQSVDSEIDLFHNDMEDNIYNQLKIQYGEDNVSTENKTGNGTKIDIVVKHRDNFTFYELKTYNSIKKCIREALSQLMEYAYFPNEERANELIIVSHNPVDKNTIDYLSKLRVQFKLPIYYQRYNIEKQKLEIEKF